MHPIKRKHLYGYIYPLTPEIIPEIFNHGIFFYIKTGSEHHLQQCLSKINKVDPLIKFDFNYSKNQIPNKCFGHQQWENNFREDF